MTRLVTAPPTVPVLLGASLSPDGKEVLFYFATGEQDAEGQPVTVYAETDRAGVSAVLTGEAPVPRALLILFQGDTEMGRFLLGVPLADLRPELLEAFPDLEQIHPAQLAAHLREKGRTLVYPVPGLPDVPTLFPTLEDAQADLLENMQAIVHSAAGKLFGGESGEPLEGMEAEAGAALLALMGAALEHAAEGERDFPDTPERIPAEAVHLTPSGLTFTPSGRTFRGPRLMARPEGDAYALAVWDAGEVPTVFTVPVSVLYDLETLDNLDETSPLEVLGDPLPPPPEPTPPCIFPFPAPTPLLTSAEALPGGGVRLTCGNDFRYGLDAGPQEYNYTAAGYAFPDHDGPGLPLLTVYSPGRPEELAPEDWPALYHLTVYVMPDALADLERLGVTFHRGDARTAHHEARRAAWYAAGRPDYAARERHPHALN